MPWYEEGHTIAHPLNWRWRCHSTCLNTSIHLDSSWQPPPSEKPVHLLAGPRLWMPALTGTQLLFTLDLQHRSPLSKPVLYPLEQQTFSKHWTGVSTPTWWRCQLQEGEVNISVNMVQFCKLSSSLLGLTINGEWVIDRNCTLVLHREQEMHNIFPSCHPYP